MMVKNTEKQRYYNERYYAKKEYIYCDICKIYKTKRNTDLKRHKKLIHQED